MYKYIMQIKTKFPPSHFLNKKPPTIPGFAIILQSLQTRVGFESILQTKQLTKFVVSFLVGLFDVDNESESTLYLIRCSSPDKKLGYSFCSEKN